MAKQYNNPVCYIIENKPTYPVCENQMYNLRNILFLEVNDYLDI